MPATFFQDYYEPMISFSGYKSSAASPLDTLTRLGSAGLAAGATGREDDDRVQIVLRHGDRTVELQCRLLADAPDSDGESTAASTSTFKNESPRMQNL